MNEKLKYIFENVNNWLNFAEAKNAAIVALNVAIIFGIFSIQDINSYKLYIFVPVVLVLLSLIISLYSFVPMTSNSVDKKLEFWANRAKATENIFLYSYIGKKFKTDNVDLYLKMVAKAIDVNNYRKNGEDEDLAKEIIYNAKITIRKYELFRISITILIIAIVILTLLALLWVLDWDIFSCVENIIKSVKIKCFHCS